MNDQYKDKRIMEDIPKMPHRIPTVKWQDVSIPQSTFDGQFTTQALEAMRRSKDKTQG